MPMYSYHCDKCKRNFDVVLSISERNQPQNCTCGSKAHRDVEYELNHRGDTNAMMKENIRYSWSFAINPNNPQEVADARHRHPGVVFDFDVPNEKPLGRMQIRNRKEKLQRKKEIEKAFGREMVEYSNRDL